MGLILCQSLDPSRIWGAKHKAFKQFSILFQSQCEASSKIVGMNLHFGSWDSFGNPIWES
jgi:hypothetical protein